ncbi:MAG: hypothetical protein IPH07_31675 [Deltaproteobacteria bacterium]|nr:hypothetical protein [Deltaproteobacteria bacterium]MBK8715475.1 hypothetical protein [Deltaproteobacteria bacterium]MBP7288378.1 hypothetical protein [Nannocystaceae bacterium]
MATLHCSRFNGVRSWLVLFAPGALGACGEPPDEARGEGGGQLSITLGAVTQGVESSDDDGAVPTGDGSVFDVAAEGGGQASVGDGATGCKKVDFLFVIDNSSSMSEEQDALIASFPGFIQTIQSTLTDAQDHHIMVTDTDAAWGGDCSLLCGFFGGFCPSIPDYPCATGAPSVCDATLGAGVTYPIGSHATNHRCNFATGARYMDSSEPDLSGAFQCAARVGSDGESDEMAMSAMVGALSEDLGAPGSCNEGFVRDDAILVVTIITDEEDKGSTGTPEGWYANIVASKKGDASAVVMLGLINDVDQPAPSCSAQVEDAVKLRSFVEMFPNHTRGSVCAPSFNSFFEDAVALIDQTCDEFVPAG